MNRLKYFDRYQLIITIVGLLTAALSIIVFVTMLFTATIVYDENGVFSDLIYNNTLVTIYACLTLAQLTTLVWFGARTITFRMRRKEEDTL